MARRLWRSLTAGTTLVERTIKRLCQQIAGVVGGTTCFRGRSLLKAERRESQALDDDSEKTNWGRFINVVGSNFWDHYSLITRNRIEIAHRSSTTL
jgi:hypothetical protein